MSNKKQTAVEWLENKLNLLSLQYELPEDEIDELLEQAKEMEKEQQVEITENTSDGYHTFKVLYEIRKAYNVALFNDWASQIIKEKKVGGAIVESAKYNVHKSRKHNDGEYPFGNDNWFIVCANLPSGQISNHYTMDNWDLFKIPETEKALFEFVGHTTNDVINRLLNIKL
jgi:hypothetical protein